MDNIANNYKHNHNSNINKRCPKCLSVLGDSNKIVRDVNGKEFCSRDCLKDWWAEGRRSREELYDWWIGRDDCGR